MRALLIIFLGFMLSACGGHSYMYRTIDLPVATEYAGDSHSRVVAFQVEKSASSPASLADGLALDYRLTLERDEYEVRRTQRQSRYYEHIDLTNIAAGALTLGLFCMEVNCFGELGDWQNEYDGLSETSRQKTGRVRHDDVWLRPEQVVLSMRWADGKRWYTQDLGKANEVAGSKGRVNLVKQFTALPGKPVHAVIEAGYKHQDALNGHVSDYEITPTQIASLSLYSENWLPLSVRKDKYMLELRDALLNRRYYDAVTLFEKLENMPIEISAEFHYQYAAALNQIGRRDAARQHARIYIEQAGEQGAHYTDALKLL